MKWFNNQKVSVKVLLASLVFIGLIVMVSLQGISSTRNASVQFNNFYENRFMPVRNLNEILKTWLQININMINEFNAAKENDQEEIHKNRGDTVEQVKTYQGLWKEYKEGKLDDEEKKKIGEFEALVQEAVGHRKELYEGINAKNFTQAQMYYDKYMVSVKAAREILKNLIIYQQKVAETVRAERIAEARKVTILSMVFLTISIIAGAFITLVLSRSVSRPVQKGLYFAEKIANGDFTERIDLDQTDELGLLGKALNGAADSLEELITNVTIAAQNLSQAVEQIASGNENLSQRTSEQASSLEEIASTVEETNAATKQNTENAVEANNLADNSYNLASNGGKISEDAVTGIKEISDVSKKIGEITTVINEISFQTNLLALNAAVEAARAGEAGRGFAVVASEIRNLAQRSGNAAKEIEILIRDTIAKIENGTGLVIKSGDSLKEIIDAIKQVGKIVSEIAAASEEQRQGIEQITIAVTELDSMTQQNAALVEETASAGEEMANQAQELLGMTQRFKLSNKFMDQGHLVKHKELHIKAAERAAAAKKAKDVSAAPAVNKPDAFVMDKAKTSQPQTREIKDVMAEDGFEEF